MMEVMSTGKRRKCEMAGMDCDLATAICSTER